MNKIKQSIIKDYENKAGLYEDFAKAVAFILGVLLKDKKFFFQVISPRAKTIDSLEYKLNRSNLKKLNIKKYSDIQDLAGVRIIFYLESDAKRFTPYIYDEFGDKNIIKHESKIDEDGYNATHLVIRLDEDRLKLSEYSKYKDLKCEIQLTTVLYHAWSEMAHDLIYKPKRTLLDFDRRSFEVLDKHFKEVMENHIKKASISFEAIYYKFKEIQKGRDIFDRSFLESISRSDSNNKIYQQLVLLEKYTAKFGDKIPEEMNIIKLLEEVIDKSKVNKIESEKTIFGKLPGKTYSDIVIKCLEILNHIKYIKIPDTFNILTKLHQEPDEKIKNKAKEVLERLVEYNLYVLRQKGVGYAIQRVILDTILGWSQKEKIKNIEIIKIVASKLLQSSFEGSAMTDWNKLTLSFGALQPTSYLKKIRKDTIDLIIALYKKFKDVENKISLLKVLENASRYPSQGDYSEIKDKMDGMITNDVKGLVNFYESTIFNKNGNIITEPLVVEEVEHQLNWVDETQRNEVLEIDKLLEKIKKDETYHLYRLLIGDVYEELKIAEGWERKEEERVKEINLEFEKINTESVKVWIQKLNLIAENKSIVDEWKFGRFNGFLLRIAREKTKLAKIILDDAFENSKPLKNFTGWFLAGFRQINNVKIWDEYADKLSKEKDIALSRDLIFSISFTTESEQIKFIRKRDIDLLTRVVNRQKPFEFLNKIDNKNELVNLNYIIINVLSKIYKKNKMQIELLIKTLIRNDPENLWIYTRELYFAVRRGTLNLLQWSKQGIDFILDRLVEVRDLNYDAQGLLFEIAKKNYQVVTEVFIKRIKKQSGMTKQSWVSANQYDAIPYHFNDELKEYVRSQKEYPKIVENWMKKMTLKWSIYNSELAQFLQRIDGPILNKILLKKIKTGNKDNLSRVINILEGIEPPDFNICFKIIQKTSDEKIWNRVIAAMERTGTVSGEYGISEAYEKKIEIIESYKSRGSKKENGRVGKFKRKVIKNLQQKAKKERQRADEEIKLRKIEFEG